MCESNLRPGSKKAGFTEEFCSLVIHYRRPGLFFVILMPFYLVMVPPILEPL